MKLFCFFDKPLSAHKMVNLDGLKLKGGIGTIYKYSLNVFTRRF